MEFQDLTHQHISGITFLSIMPELPEVETTCRGIRPHIINQSILRIDVLEPRLRWPVSSEIATLHMCQVLSVNRRAKYILLETDHHHDILLHLGMSGSLRICSPDEALKKHDHLIFLLSSGQQMRYHDPRRFGCVLWIPHGGPTHPLLEKLGPEPLSDSFSAASFIASCSLRKRAIKLHIMDNHIVVGVGNIYACEALFQAGIHPNNHTHSISAKRLKSLHLAIRSILTAAIEQGGTTLRDFIQSDGKPGYFKQKLSVYGRENQPCLRCQSPIQRITLGQRSTFFCPNCQS